MEENKAIMTAPEGENVQLDAAYVISKIEQIMAESQHLQKALGLLESEHMDELGSTALAIGNMIQAREETNRAMITLLRVIIQKL